MHTPLPQDAGTRLLLIKVFHFQQHSNSVSFSSVNIRCRHYADTIQYYNTRRYATMPKDNTVLRK